MPCCVPKCVPAIGYARVRFPSPDLLRARWKQAIEVGTGVGLTVEDLPDGSSQLLEICLDHFANPEDIQEYQEPTLFVDENGHSIELVSCRLCLQFQPVSDTVPLSGLLSTLDSLHGVFQQTTRIQLNSSDMICTECLVKMDLIHALQSQFAAQEMLYRSLQSTGTTCQLEVVEAIVQDEYGEHKVEPLDEADFDNVGQNFSEELSQEAKVYKRNRSKKDVKLSSLIARKCYLCRVPPFVNPVALLYHLNKEHNPEGDLACAECNDGKKFQTIQRFNRHMSHHDSEERPLKCGFCPMRYCDEHGVHCHENREHGTHHEVRAVHHRPTACEECGRMFASKSNKRRHWKNAHDGLRSKFECEFCEAELTSSKSLHLHVLGHSKPVGHKCEICSKWFRTEAVLHSRHRKRCLLRQEARAASVTQKDVIRKAKKPFACGVCEKTFRTGQMQQKHLRNHHSGEKRS